MASDHTWIDQQNVLTAINLDDIVVALGWQAWPPGRTLARALFGGPARAFAQQVMRFDQQVARLGLQEGARCFLPDFVSGTRIYGAENLPKQGPLLILSNHPGMVDTLALFAALPRADLRVVASERPFLQMLPALSKHLIYVPEQKAGRLQVLRDILACLRGGGSVLTFPAGQIEPDPAVLPGAVDALAHWSESIAIPIRLVPDLQVVVAVVSGVLARQATYHPLTRLRRHPKDRERLGATLQLLMKTWLPTQWPVQPEVYFAPPLSGADLAQRHDPRAIRQAVIDAAAQLMMSGPQH